MEDIVYFNSHYAKTTHDYIIDTIGGRPGIKDEGTLESCLEFLKNDDYYPTFERKLSRLVFSVTQFHMFEDGNKRSAIALGTFFLRINDFDYCTDTFIEEMENIVLWIANGFIDEELLTDIITSIINENCINEEIALKLSEIQQYLT